MIMGGDLFRRFFLRFLMSLVLAFLLFLALVHVFQQRIMDGEWRADLREQAYWLALHTGPESAEMLAGAWMTTHETIRLTFFDANGRMLADSHPQRPPLDLQVLQTEEARDYLAAVEEMRGGGWLAISRPRVPAFPSGLQWELIATALILVGLVVTFLRPFVRSMSSTLRKLTEIAKEVSSGHFGKTLDVQRTDELGTLVHAINDMSGKLEEAEKLNTRLLHDVSHELRSPLGRIQVMAQTIGMHPDEADEYIHGIGQEIALLDRLVGDLVESARIESDSPAARPERFSLLQWSGETLRRLESEARSRKIGWTSRLPPRDLEVCGDPQRLAQAVGNLVDNAITALDGHSDARIEVTIAVTDVAWSVAVEDNGPGIPADDLPHVFRRFYRVDTDRGRDRGGVGLGLSLVRAIAEAQGGKASIESQAGEGTTALISFPIGKETLPVDSERSPTSRENASGGRQPVAPEGAAT